MPVPLGRAIRWTEEQIDAFLDVDDEDIQVLRSLWQKYSRRPTLIDAKLQDDTTDAITETE